MELWEIAVIVVFTTMGATVHASVGIGIGLVAGPALIAEDQTTTVVTAAFTAHVDARGYLRLRRQS